MNQQRGFLPLIRSTGLSFLAVVLALGLSTPRVIADEDDFDRLDGTGVSKMKVDVIEWEGNLELHFYPKGRLQGLGMKIDRTKKDKPVMVISYRFAPVPGRVLASTGEGSPGHPLIRRAILGISLRDDFKVFRDPEPTDYDKVIVTNNTMASPLVAFQTDAAPKQLYPDGHPMNGEKKDDKKVASPKIDLVPPESKGVFTKDNGVNPELKDTSKGREDRVPATGEPAPAKFQNEKIDQNTSGNIKVQEINLDRGFRW